MKNKLAVLWVRIAAYVVGTISAIVLGVSVLVLLFISVAGTEEEILHHGYHRIAENYLAYVLDEYFDDPEEVEKKLEDTNLYYTIIKDIPVQDGNMVFDDVSTHIYSNVPEGMEVEYAYTLQGMSSEHYIYHISHLLGALETTDSYDGKENWPVTTIQKITLDKNNKLFYLQTEAGYFLLNYVYVKEDRKYYDYMLETINGERCYYNSYYERTLNMDNYSNWTGISWGDVRYVIDPNEVDGILRVEEDSTVIQEELMSVNFEIDGKVIRYSSKNEPVYTVAAVLTPELDREDLLKEWHHKITWIYAMEDSLMVYESIAIILFLISLVLLIYTAKGEKEELRLDHKCPLLIYLCLVVAAESGLGALGVLLFQGINERVLNISVNTIVYLYIQIAAVMVVLLFWCISNLATRIKTRTLFRYSELYYITRPFVKLWGILRNVWKGTGKNQSLIWKVIVGLLVIDVLQFSFLYGAVNWYYRDTMIWIFMVYKLVEFIIVLLIVFQMVQLQKGSARIANGDLSEPIDTSKMLGAFKTHGENINKVGEGISKAVDNQLKSERFKTELITNVSHDIKTPLTSIINYVDLMKKEEITDPTLCEYVEVLDRQSGRLKKLIEDLMEASKASTGNIKVEPEECDISMLMGQVAGEFEDRFTACGLETVITKPEMPIYVMADGRHLWRVLDNLMTNICKYSLPNSRVYMDLEQREEQAVIQFKNISKTQLNISSEELMERFVRGDSSRNTEGSGLGLSIAQSLTELMGGTMKLEIDGDLFKVILTYAVMDMSETETSETKVL